MTNCIHDAIILPWPKYTKGYIWTKPKHTWGYCLSEGYSWSVIPAIDGPHGRIIPKKRDGYHKVWVQYLPFPILPGEKIETFTSNVGLLALKHLDTYQHLRPKAMLHLHLFYILSNGINDCI